MKNLLLISALALLGLFQVSAQEYEYVPFVREGVKWVCYYNNVGDNYYDQYFHEGKNYFTLELKGDTVIDGQQYKALHKYSGEAINTQEDTVLVYLREKDRIVYGICPEGKTYRGFQEIMYCGHIYQDAIAGKEFILFDFNDPSPYYTSFYSHTAVRNLYYKGYDTLTIGGKLSKRHVFNSNDREDYYIIEGIGVDGYRPGYLLSYLNLHLGTESETPYYLSHVVENGEIIYKSVNYGEVAPTDGRMPIVREGVKWVNEKVIVNRGDTTRYYYTYEIQGDDERKPFTKKCHYYTGNNIDSGNDSIICALNEYPFCWYVYCYDNLALEKVMEENRNLLCFTDTLPDYRVFLYDISRFEDILPDAITVVIQRNARQEGRLHTINYDNFIMVDPIEVDGHECLRWAFIDEQGEPLAYLVEGIGFDSRDMGDLLTPFTRKPDPDAEYQEWCGLSHVIKDGKIIYKGMCYDAAHVEGAEGITDGDVNGDGLVNIADVTALINLLLHENGQSFNAGADLDSNGNVNLKDLVELIDFILVR